MASVVYFFLYFIPAQALSYFFPEPQTKCSLWLPAGWVGFGPCPVDPALPTASQWEVLPPYQLWCKRLAPGAVSLPQGWRAPYTHGFFICGSPRRGPWISISFHHSSSLLDSVRVWVRVNPCVFTSVCSYRKTHPPFCHSFIFLLFFSLIAHFCHACTSGTSSLTMRLTLNLCF